MKRLNVLFILLAFVILIQGCATTSQLCTVPEAQNSVICELSGKLKTTPEMISKSLRVANFGALTADIYTPPKADAFVDQIIADVKGIQKKGGKISYIEIINYIDGKLKVLPAKVKVVFAVDPLDLSRYSIKQPLTNYDFDLILRHLQKQKELIKVYL
jgi:hypothetical protein